MKKLSLTFALILFTFLTILKPLHAQWDYWSNPVPITDSVSDNKNATMQFLNFIENDYYVFWEKSNDTLSTAVYYKNFYNGDKVDIFLSVEGVHYTNPQLMDTRYGFGDDTLWSVFYLSDESGKNQIYYRVYNQPEGFTGEQIMNSSEEEQTNLHCSNEGRIVWMEQNRIMTAQLDKETFTFSEAVVIDSGNCSFPSLVEMDDGWKKRYARPELAWIKEENDSSSIWIINYDSEAGWLEPEKQFTGAQCTNLSFCSGFGSPYILTWDYYNDTSWHVIHYDIEEADLYLSVFEQNEPFQPKFFSGYIPVKSRWIDAGFSSIVYSSDDTIDIYTSDYFFEPITGLDYYQNISKSNHLVRNPQLFFGKYESPCNTFINNIWEERVNDHWQLKYAETSVCLSDVVEEIEPDNLQLKTNPNPFTEEIALSFLLNKSADVSLSIYNSSGEKMETLISGKLAAGQHDYKWNGKMAKASLYFVSLQINSKQITKKIILIK